MDSISKTIAATLKGLTSSGIKRLQYMPYKMDVALAVIDRIGKRIEPNFCITDEIQDTYVSLVQYFHGDPAFKGDLNRGILLMGPTGSGKTLAMKIMSVYRQIDDTRYVINGKSYRMNYEVVPVDRIISDFLSQSYDALRIYMTRYVVCLDDMGTESEYVKFYGNNLDVIGLILSERYSKRLLTFGTTNLPLTNLEEKYDDRIVSRMFSLFNFITMKGKDFRKS
jgi:DNA replication protein DnaC